MDRSEYYYYQILTGCLATPTEEGCVILSKIKKTQKGIYEDIKLYHDDFFYNKPNMEFELIQVGDMVHFISRHKGYGILYIMNYYSKVENIEDYKILQII